MTTLQSIGKILAQESQTMLVGQGKIAFMVVDMVLGMMQAVMIVMNIFVKN